MSTCIAQLLRRRPAVIAPAAAVALLTGASPVAAQGRSSAGSAGRVRAVTGGTWGKAEEVPGTAVLNTGGNAAVQSVSCPSKGSCSTGGYYTNAGGSPPAQVFVVSEVNGSWGKAEQVPGIAALNTGGGTQINSVSCASAGNCSAGGYYTVSLGDLQAFVVNQVNGTLGKARQVPGTATLNQGGGAGVNWLSCASAGNCSAGGQYTDSSGVNGQAFVVTQTNGTWGKAREVPGTATLNQTGFAVVYSVSCTSAGNCDAGGEYNDSSGNGQAFVVTQANGTWGKAKEVPGTAILNTGGGGGVNGAAVYSLSCASADNCSAAGNYKDSSGHFQVFVASKVNSTWGKAKEIPGTATLNTGGNARTAAVPCASAGNCDAGGDYSDSTGNSLVFVASGPTAPGARQRKSPALPPSTPSDSTQCSRCHAPRRAPAAQVASTRAWAACRHSSSTRDSQRPHTARPPAAPAAGAARR
jgi:hypothetical protein